MQSKLVVLAAILVLVLGSFFAGQRLSAGEAYESKGISIYFSPGGGAQHALLKEIRGAKKTIDVAIFTLTDSDLVKALETEAANGVMVRLIADHNEAKHSYSKVKKLPKSEAFQVLRYVPRPPADGGAKEWPKMHNKFCIIDGKVVVTGSYNWTRAAENKNCENLLILRDKRVAAAYLREFDSLWKLALE